MIEITSVTDFVLAIDPGFQGAAAILRCDNGFRSPHPSGDINLAPEIISVHDLPLKTDSLYGGGKGRYEIDGAELGRILGPYAGRLALAVIESVAASPQMGVTSAFRFGEGYGLVNGLIAGVLPGVRVARVVPSVWKGAINLNWQKALSLNKAAQVFGEEARERYFPLKKHDGRAEALLLAWYGLRLIPKENKEIKADASFAW